LQPGNGVIGDEGFVAARDRWCRINGVGLEDSPERPAITLATLVRLLDIVPPRCRALVLLATFASLRFGELAALRRCDLDLERCSVKIVAATAENDGGRLIDQNPEIPGPEAHRRIAQGDRAGAARAPGAEPGMTPGPLSADDIRRLFGELASELDAVGQRAEIFLVGGAAIALCCDGASCHP
jgi:integrase